MTIYLVRHAKAGSRGAWEGPDDQRPLSKPGCRQADALADMLVPAEPSRIISSPYVRCRQTVDPLAARLLLPVELSEGLAEGALLADTRALLDKVGEETTVLSTHGDVIGWLLDDLVRAGVVLDDDRLEKGSTWILEVEAGAVVRGRYQAPPA